MGITKKRFVEILLEEGLPGALVERLWARRPMRIPLNEETLRLCARVTWIAYCVGGDVNKN